jgi:hypothetical protein
MPEDTSRTVRPDVLTRFTRERELGIPNADDRNDRSIVPSGKLRRRKLSADDEEMSAARTSPDVMDTLSAEERADVEEHAPAIRTALLKAVMARAEPTRFIVADDQDNDADLERSAMRAISVLDDSLVERLVPRVNRLLRDEPNARRMMGANVTRNLREPLRIKRIRPRITLRPPQQQERAGASPPQTVYTRALVELRAVHCLRITEPRDNPDEMVLGTILVGASGNVKAGRSFDLDTFHSGDLFSYGDLPIGQYSLKTTDGYPKHMYVLFKLVETDADGRETARDLTKAIGGMAQGIVSVFAGAMAGATAGMLVSAIGGFFQGLIDEDEFPIVGKRLTLNHMHDLGGSVGPRERTGDIGGHGGKYRIGFRWLMGA